MRMAALLLLLSSLSALASPEDYTIDPTIKLPLAPEAAPGHEGEEDQRLVVNLSKSGEIRINLKQLDFGDPVRRASAKEKSGLTAVSLNRLSRHLSQLADVYHRVQKVKGRSGKWKNRRGIEYSSLFVLVRADRDAPWAHVQWILVVLAEQRFVKTQLAVARKPAEVSGRCSVASKLDVYLPTEGDWSEAKKNPRHLLRATVSIMAGREQEKPWGPKSAKSNVMLPTEVHYGFARCWFPPGEFKREQLRHWIRSAKSAIGDPTVIRLFGEVRPSHKVPVAAVVSVLELFRSAGYQHIHVFGEEVPGPELRKRQTLPYPEANHVCRGVGGTGCSSIFATRDDRYCHPD